VEPVATFWGTNTIRTLRPRSAPMASNIRSLPGATAHSANPPTTLISQSHGFLVVSRHRNRGQLYRSGADHSRWAPLVPVLWPTTLNQARLQVFPCSCLAMTCHCSVLHASNANPQRPVARHGACDQLRANTTNPFAGITTLAEARNPCRGGPDAPIPPPLPATIGLTQLS